jgi:hypothetical protein
VPLSGVELMKKGKKEIAADTRYEHEIFKPNVVVDVAAYHSQDDELRRYWIRGYQVCVGGGYGRIVIKNMSNGKTKEVTPSEIRLHNLKDSVTFQELYGVAKVAPEVIRKGTWVKTITPVLLLDE